MKTIVYNFQDCVKIENLVTRFLITPKKKHKIHFNHWSKVKNERFPRVQSFADPRSVITWKEFQFIIANRDFPLTERSPSPCALNLGVFIRAPPVWNQGYLYIRLMFYCNIRYDGIKIFPPALGTLNLIENIIIH